MSFDRRRDDLASTRPGAASQVGTPGKRSLVEQIAPAAAPVQRKAAGTLSPAGEGAAVQLAAEAGTRGPRTALPHGDTIQRAFGRHDVSQIQAHVGGAAADASAAIGAEAYATGHHVAFADAPSLHTAAHEAAHVIQQRGGVQLLGGVGQAGDAHEQHADAVADRVVRGESAEALLDSHAGGAAGAGGAVQRKPSLFAARLAGDRLFNLTPLQTLQQSAWHTYTLQIKPYFAVEDDDERRQRVVFANLYQRATRLRVDYQGELKEPQRQLATEIQGMLETERLRLFGGGGVRGGDPTVRAPDTDLTPKADHGAFQNRFDRDDPTAWPVFDGPPSIAQIQQGNLGDCYLIASIASVVHSNPEHFFSHILDNLDGRVTVKLYQRDGAPVNVVVEKSVVGGHCAHGSLWAALLEKAYIAAGFRGSAGKEDQGGAKTYAAAEAGGADLALTHLTGKRTGGFAIGAGRAAVSERVADELRAESQRLERELRELDRVIGEKKARKEPTTADDERAATLIKQLEGITKPRGELFATLDLHYVSRGSMQALIDKHADQPGFGAAVRRATGLDSVDPLLPGELGSGSYGRDERQLFARIKQNVDAGEAVTACTKNQLEDADNVAEAEKGNAGETKVSGLAGQHEYSVLGYTPHAPQPGEPIKIQLRNPWGNYGRKYITQLGKQKGVAVNGGDGVFWLDLADMVSFFSSLTFTRS